MSTGSIPADRAAAAATASAVDMERFDLRRFIDALGADEVERVGGPTDLADAASLMEGNPKVVLLERPAGESVPLAGNVAGSRKRLATAFGTTPDKLLGEVLRRLGKKGELVEVAGDAAPVQQVVLTGDQCDFTKLPIHLQHGLDGAPYVSASIDFVVDPNTGWTNVGVRRLMLRGRRTAGIDLVAPSDLRAIYIDHASRGERLPIAFAVGTHPIDHVAATMRIPTDELALIAALRDAPLGVVKCVSNDLRVPADAQFILEGYLDERGHVEPEGPYGEFLGYYGGVKLNPVFHLTAITHRREPVFQTAANNAGAQTSFIPMLTLGIPSNPVMALMIGAMIIQGIQPGPAVMTEQPALFWGLIASMWIGNAFLVVLNLPMIGLWVRMIMVPYRMLYPAILLFCSIGVLSLNNNNFDVYMMALFGLFGYVCSKLDCEPAPLLLGFIIGPMMEEYLRRAMLLSRADPMVFLASPLSATMLVLAVIALAAVTLPALSRKREVAFAGD